ncbi:unnamed protein product [Cyclocybe aegerita]|uniref:RTA1-like protein n=1 Tax=Cyclocybe aegerita TaxID=1973307 RepID=A0A8S0WVJ8_CYCAE|nr:unnamed protein product [Cyclocybe aegerita]
MANMRSALPLVLLGLVSQAAAVIKFDIPRPDPFLDPKNDPYNPLKYIVSNTLTGISVALVLVVAVLQTWCIKRWGARWMSAMTIGAYCFAIGLAFRFGLAIHPQSKGIYIVEYLFVVLSPCAFIAADYVLLGRLARHVQSDRHLLVSPHNITLVFVSSDITTFLIQAIGGSISVSANDYDRALAGSRVFLAGLAAQLLSFSSFTCIFIRFLHRVRKYEPKAWAMDEDKKWYNSWKTLAVVLFISCMGIMVRSVFRVIELSEGFQGPLTTSEALFYALDTLPLFVAIVVYVPFWPGRFIRPQENPVQNDAVVDSEKGSQDEKATV